MTTPYKKPKVEVADIFKNFGHLLSKQPKANYKAINAITNCRTGALGGHLLKCGSCDREKQAYNSCRNRHCPKCQFTARQRWIEARTEDLLPCKYFHTVFTVPSELRPLMLRNKSVCYSILFESSSETLKEVAKTHYKADFGFIGVLHTWSQELIDHPHVHFIVPGGGLSSDKTQWVPAREEYLLPVRVLSKIFRTKMLEKIEKAFDKNQLVFPGAIESLSHSGIFRDLMVKCSGLSFNVDARKPFSGPKAVIRYLGQYTHRIAISNHRLVQIKEGRVDFKVRDRSDPEKKKIMSLPVEEFMRRFLLHVLPKSFVRIRHYGILGSRAKKVNAVTIRKLNRVQIDLTQRLKESWQQTLKRVTGVDPEKCSHCKDGRFQIKAVMGPMLAPG